MSVLLELLSTLYTTLHEIEMRQNMGDVAEREKQGGTRAMKESEDVDHVTEDCVGTSLYYPTFHLTPPIYRADHCPTAFPITKVKFVKVVLDYLGREDDEKMLDSTTTGEVIATMEEESDRNYQDGSKSPRITFLTSTLVYSNPAPVSTCFALLVFGLDWPAVLSPTLLIAGEEIVRRIKVHICQS
tara:strand:+ start:369 stop:926 length:558 start_codon:yes stop_codon:yes gene_type:complete